MAERSSIWVAILFSIYSCSSKNNKDLTYQQLPSDVKAKFQYVYNHYEPPKVNSGGDTIDWYLPPFSECYNLNKNCNCEIESRGGILRNPFFVIKSCNKKVKISWEVLERVFIIKNDSIYYPYHTEKVKYEDVNNGEEFDQVVGGTLTVGKPRSFNIKIDTMGFYVQKME